MSWISRGAEDKGGRKRRTVTRLTSIGLQGNVEQILASTLGPQRSVVGGCAGAKHQPAHAFGIRVVVDDSKDVKVAAVVHALGDFDLDFQAIFLCFGPLLVFRLFKDSPFFIRVCQKETATLFHLAPH